MIPKYINWKKECKITHFTIEEFNKKIEELNAKGYEKVRASTRTLDYPTCSYSVKKDRNKYLTLAVIDEFRDRFFYSTNWRDDEKNKSRGAGTDAFNAVNQEFEKRTGLRITKAFGSVPDEFKTCVPRQFYYINKFKTNQIYLHVSAIDFCSQYPSCLCGTLPDGHTDSTKQIKGTVPPTKEYPFAFYIKSGHVAEYNFYDTHDWKYSYFASSLFGKKESFDGNPYLDPEDDITILMKASKYELTPEMQYFYKRRKIDPTAKLVMNAFIGMLHTESYKAHKQAHIAAIVIARSNNRMMLEANSIGIDRVLHLCVDGCIYQGTDIIGTDKKDLQLCFQEFHDCTFKMIGMNCYVAMKDGKVVKFRHGAYDDRTDGKPIDVCNSFDDMKFWKRRTIKEEILNGI